MENEKGQSLIEFAMVIGFLLLVMFGIIDFSRLYFAYATMSNGVREGARYGIIHPGDDAGIIAAAESMMVVIGGDVAVSVAYPDEAPDPNNAGKIYNYCPHLCRVVVQAQSNFDVWTPVLPSFQIVTTSTMHIE
jgi:hypothetical protein